MMKSYSNNLQAFRFAAACTVLLSHSMILVSGDRNADGFLQFTKGQLTFGGLAISFFFLAAGFFAFGSLRKKRIPEFLKGRAFRLLPPLWVTVILSILMGGILTELPVTAYFTDFGTLKYLLNGLLVPVHELPGVFRHHIYTSTVNGALWTLPLEAAGYVTAAFLWAGFQKLFPEKGADRGARYGFVLLVAGLIPLYCLGFSPTILRCAGMFGLGFFGAAVTEKKSLIPGRAVLAAFLLLIPVMILGGIWWEVWLYLCFPVILYAVFFESPLQVPGWMARTGNASYEMYLVGFPIQQVLLEVWPGIPMWIHFAATLVTDLIVAYFIHRMLDVFLYSRGKKKMKPGKTIHEK